VRRVRFAGLASRTPNLAYVLRGSHIRISPGDSGRPKLFSGAQLGFISSRKLRAGKKSRAAVALETNVAFDPHVTEAGQR